MSGSVGAWLLNLLVITAKITIKVHRTSLNSSNSAVEHLDVKVKTLINAIVCRIFE
jgi:hypothetical protein